MSVDVLAFELFGVLYACDSVNVSEVVRYKSVAVVPDAHPFVLGVTSVRGRIITVFDLASALDVVSPLGSSAAMSAEPMRHLILLRYGSEELGVPISRILGVENAEELELLAGVGPHVRGAYLRFGRTCIVLSPVLLFERIMAQTGTQLTA
jgi:chemotaxis signal transduction protein